MENFVVAGNRVSSDSWTTWGVVSGYSASPTNGDIVGRASTGFLPRSAVFHSEGEIARTNLNIIDNTLVDSGYGYYCTGSEMETSYAGGTTLTLTNTNLHGNSSSRWPGMPRTTNSNCTFPSLTGTALLDVDPLYTGVTGATSTSWNLHLQPGSPAVETGVATALDADAPPSDHGAHGGGWRERSVAHALSRWRCGCLAARTTRSQRPRRVARHDRTAGREDQCPNAELPSRGSRGTNAPIRSGIAETARCRCAGHLPGATPADERFDVDRRR